MQTFNVITLSPLQSYRNKREKKISKYTKYLKKPDQGFIHLLMPHARHKKAFIFKSHTQGVFFLISSKFLCICLKK